jgi:hypothetical protein
MSTMGGVGQLERRRALEALRAGVPNRDAVAVLGSAQPEVEDRFLSLLDGVYAVSDAGPHPGGMLVGGGFGSGKSHLLEHLAHLALDRGFVVSKVVISKETPLHDPVKVLRAAVEAAVAADRRSALTGLTERLRTDSPAWLELCRWANSPGARLNGRFPATLLLYERLREGNDEFAEQLVRFWAGDPLGVPDLRRRLRELGEGATYALEPVTQRELVRQRVRFMARLLRAAGHTGWVVLFDEVELIGRYSLLQRGRSYAELARWARGQHGDQGAPLTGVLAMTDDFEAAVLSAKGDVDLVPAKLRLRATEEAEEISRQAEVGMRIIDREMALLAPPNPTELDRTYARLKAMHGEAFGWDPPEVEGLDRMATTRMRQYVRAWINEWDLLRLDPDFSPSTEVVDVTLGYGEDADLEGAGDGSDGD